MNKLSKRIEQAKKKWRTLEQNREPVLYVGAASCGRAAGALDLIEDAKRFLAEKGVKASIVEVGCIGPCYLEPLMDVALPGKPRVSYANVNPVKARKVLTSCLVEGNLLPKVG